MKMTTRNRLSVDERMTISRGTQDPVWFITNILGLKPWKMQRKIIRSVMKNRRTRVRSCHGIGKSTIAAAAVLNFVSNHENCICLTTATSSRQVKGILWREIRNLHAKAKYPLGGRLSGTRWDLGKQTTNGDWWAWGFTAPDYDADKFQGFHAPDVLVIIDEAAGVSEAVYEGLDSAMATGNAHCLEIGNPTDASGPFGQAFDNPEDDAVHFHVSAFDTPNFTQYGITLDDIRNNTWEQKVTTRPHFPFLVNPDWVREKWIKWTRRGANEDDPRWVSRVLGQFPSAGVHALIPGWWVEEAFKRWHKYTREQTWGDGVAATAGLDVARDGPDDMECAIYEIGRGVRELKQLPKEDDLMKGCGRLIDRVRTWEDVYVFENNSVRIDADGLGAGLHDRYREQYTERAVEIRSGKAASDPDHFINRRSEMLWQLREALNPHNPNPIALPPDIELKRQLSAIKWEMDSKGKRIVEPKKVTKKTLGCSPDKADACAYAVCEAGDYPGTPVLDPDVFKLDPVWDI